MKKYILGIAVLLLSSCGTIFCGSNQKLTFDSNINSIKIYANGALICSSTPCSVDIGRESSSLTIIAKADGYEDEISQIKTKINPVSFGNLISPYSWTTDFATSSMWKYNNEGIYINMKRTNTTKAELIKFNKESQIRHFAMLNYAEIKSRNFEYIKALTELTGLENRQLTTIITSSPTEIELADNLVKFQ